jgi:redox-sensing transcriptional repressor
VPPHAVNPASDAEGGVSPLTLNRLSVYLRCLRALQAQGVARISSQELARRYLLSATQIRKDLAQFGGFGIRGVGYDVDELARHLNSLLGLDREHPLVIVGMGNLGSALAHHPGFNEGAFRVVAGVDRDPAKVGRDMGRFIVRPSAELPAVVRDSGAEIGVLAIPADSAQQGYDALVAAGVRAVLNFAPARIERDPAVPVKNVDLRIQLEELGFLLRER